MEPPYIDSMKWLKWHVFWVDERVVPKDHEDSNYKLAYDGFLSKVPYQKIFPFAFLIMKLIIRDLIPFGHVKVVQADDKEVVR